MCIFSLSAVWTDDAVAEYAKVFGPIVEQSRRVLGKKQIESLKSNNSVLESISTIIIKKNQCTRAEMQASGEG